jgi:chromodomain-helicase-DNA-binding protein 1-like
MRRAERKLQLSHNIIGGDATDETGENLENEPNDMRSIIFGLHLFDPTDTAAETINEDSSAETISAETLNKLETMSEKIIMMRSDETKYEQAFEVNPNLIDSSGTMVRRVSDSLSDDPGISEAAYLSWVKRFKDASYSIEEATVQLGRRRAAPEEKLLKRDANKKKAEEKRLAKWQVLGYQTLSVKYPDIITSQNTSDSGSVQLVYGDCTDPSKLCPGKPAIILRYNFLEEI